MTSVLGRITEKDVRSDPFPYLTTGAALKPADYRRLAACFPDVPAIIRKFGADWAIERLSANNALLHVNGLKAFSGDVPIDPVWRDFLRYHYSDAFYRQAIALLGDGIRRTYPHLERRLGKKLEELTVQPRLAQDTGADLRIDIQFAINTPVRDASRVRARHVDNPNKLFAGLFYMRAPEDDSVGGDLEICRWRGPPRFRNDFIEGQPAHNTHIDDDQAGRVETVEYRANALVLFVNSPHSVHGVTQRRPTPHFRRYINMLVETREPLYDLDRYRNDNAPWALTMAR